MEQVFNFLTESIVIPNGYFVLVAVLLVTLPFWAVFFFRWGKQKPTIEIEKEVLEEYLRHLGLLDDFYSNDTQNILDDIEKEEDKNGNLARNLVLTLRQNAEEVFLFSNKENVMEILQHLGDMITSQNQDMEELKTELKSSKTLKKKEAEVEAEAEVEVEAEAEVETEAVIELKEETEVEMADAQKVFSVIEGELKDLLHLAGGEIKVKKKNVVHRIFGLIKAIEDRLIHK